MIPNLFSRVVIRFGKPIYISADLSEDEFGQKRLMIEQRLEELYEDTDRMWEDPEKISEIFSSRAKTRNYLRVLKR